MNNRFEDFTTYMLELNRYIQKMKEKEMQKFDLHASHTMYLYYLYKYQDGLTSSKLTDLCKEDKAATSRNIKQLIDKGYVTLNKEDGKKNYRGLYLLTDSGLDLASTIIKRTNEILATISNGLNDDDRFHLYSSLEIILNNFKETLNDKG